ncbi:hypothetical protein LTS18_000700, partial [Coniosporium uncinatum]
WFEKWRKVLKVNVIEKYQGMLTEEDVLRAEREGEAFRLGNENAHAAVGFFSAGMRAYGEVNRQLGWPGDC